LTFAGVSDITSVVLRTRVRVIGTRPFGGNGKLFFATTDREATVLCDRLWERLNEVLM
jgi:hypothetical protein